MRWACFLMMFLFLGCQQPFYGKQLRLEMSAPQQAVLFRVENDKTVSYGGGLDAVEGKTSWHGEMNAQQQVKYIELFAATHWVTNPPSIKKIEGTGHYNIRIRDDHVDNVFTLPLNDENATLIYDFLLKVARVRFEPHLKKLPRANMDVIINRNKKQK